MREPAKESLAYFWRARVFAGAVSALRRLGASAAPVSGHVACSTISALILDMAVAAVLTLLFRRIGLQDGYDSTRPADYTAGPVGAAAATTGTEAPGHADDRVADPRSARYARHR